LVEPQTPTHRPLPRHVIDIRIGADLWYRYIGDRHHAHKGRTIHHSGSPPSSSRYDRILAECRARVWQRATQKAFLGFIVSSRLVQEGSGRSMCLKDHQ
jgi:uncharacterized protein YndB with AHSA1/START domain